MWNVGTYDPNVKGKVQAEEPRMKVLMWGIGAEQTVVVMKLLNESGTKGSESELYYSVLKICQPAMGGAYGQNKAV